MTPGQLDDLQRLAADPSDERLVRHALTAAAREIAFLRAHAAAAERGPVPVLFPGPEPDARWRPAFRPADQPRIVKRYGERLIWAGTTAEQAFRLDLTCLSRLEGTAGAAHFPAVLDWDAGAPTLTVTHAGPDLRRIAERGRPVVVPAAARQIEAMLDAMDRVRIVHLDLHPDGRNLCLRDDGHLSLIDFDIAVLDGICHSGAMVERLAEFAAEGDLRQAQHRRIVAMLDRCPLLRRG